MSKSNNSKYYRDFEEDDKIAKKKRDIVVRDKIRKEKKFKKWSFEHDEDAN